MIIYFYGKCVGVYIVKKGLENNKNNYIWTGVMIPLLV